MKKIEVSEEDKSVVSDRIDLEVRAGFTPTDEIISSGTHDLYEIVTDRDNDLKKLVSGSEKQRAQSDLIWNELKALATSMTHGLIQQLKEEEEAWVAPTDNDKLDWVFEYLEKTGIAARQDYWCCQTCANDSISRDMLEPPATNKPYFGFVYYHHQDLESAMAGHCLNVAFGVNKEASAKADSEYKNRSEIYNKQATGQPPSEFYDVNVETYRDSHLRFIQVASPDLSARRVASRFMNAAILAGLNPEWNGAGHAKIQLLVKWARRRSTSYKFKPEGAPDLSNDLYAPLGTDDDPDFYTTGEDN